MDGIIHGFNNWGLISKIYVQNIMGLRDFNDPFLPAIALVVNINDIRLTFLLKL